jgi:DNA-binding NarL/FixJ family response regulator
VGWELVGSSRTVAQGRVSIVVLDPLGSIFSTLRDLSLSSSLWRLVNARRLPGLSGVDLVIYAVYDQVDWTLVKTLLQRAPTLVITTSFSTSDATQALNHGLAGYLDATLKVEPLRRAIVGALNGEPAYAREVTGVWLRARRQAALVAVQDTDLTPRQRQIVSLIATGATDKEIGGSLGIATATAQKHVTNILERLRVPNRAAAVAVVAARSQL